MTWSLHHTESERLASEAESEERLGNLKHATQLYDLSAAAELRALNEVAPKKARTLGITAVSAVALLYKAGNHLEAKRLAEEWLSKADILPLFAVDHLREILTQMEASGFQNTKASTSVEDEFADGRETPPSIDFKAILGGLDWADGDTVSAPQRLLWLLSGASTTILSQPECRTDRAKYAAIGATILFTGMLASILGGYAFFLVFGSTTLACVFGAIWGLFILNMDRFLVGTLRKNSERAIIQELVPALPRLVMMLLFAVVMATPIELKMFQGEIENKISTDTLSQATDLRETQLGPFREISELESQNRQIETELSKIQEDRDKVYVLLAQEASDADRTGRPGQSATFQAVKERLAQIQRELDERRVRSRDLIEDNNQRIKRLRDLQDSTVASFLVRPHYGLLARLNALQALSKENVQFALANWSILLLFLMLGALPLILRLLSSAGPYDLVLEGVEHQVVINEERKRVELKIQAEMDLALRQELSRIMLDRRLNYLRHSLNATTEATTA